MKRRDRVPVLQDVSLAIPEGARVALLGHNGAGKSTLIKLILGLTPLDSGTISILGARQGSDAARQAVAHLPEAVAFQGALTGRETLRYFAGLAGEDPRQIGHLLDRVGLAEAADRRIATYSKGMRQRLGLAQVLLRRPRLALLDEPTSGLDPISRHDLYAIIDELAAGGTAVLIASHALTELEARTDRIAILSKGRLVADDTLSALSHQAGLPTRMRVRASGSDGADFIARSTGGARINGASVEITCPPGAKMATLRTLSGLGPQVSDIDVVPPGLEDLYRHYSGDLS
nr:ABC transporter ATP-binding protein [Palleronia caenipelagi]